MDPITAVLAALAAGATAAAQQTAGAAIKDAYEGIKGLLKKRFAGKAMAIAAVDAHAADPAAAESVLRPALVAKAADHDAELLDAARALLKLADVDGSIARRYSLHIAGDVQGLVQGDHATVTMSFGAPAPRGG
jgi:hypothetical protein